MSISLSRSYISGTTSSPIYGPCSFLHVSDAAVLAQARDLDQKLRRNEEVGPLVGVLVAVKDNICTAEMPSTAGSRVLEGYTPPYDATAMRKIKELGGIVVGKTNLDEFGMGNTTEGSMKLWRSLDEFGQNHKFSEVVEMKDIWRMITVIGFTSMEFSTGFE